MPTQAGPGHQDHERGAPLCPLSGFLARIMAPIEVFVLGTPATALVHEKEVEAPSVQRSGRIAKLHPEGANMEQLAMEAVARRLGSRPEEANSSERLRQEYLALWDGPLTDQVAAAIDGLVLSVKKPNVVSSITDIGSKGYHLFRFGMGCEGGWETSSAGELRLPEIYGLASITET